MSVMLGRVGTLGARDLLDAAVCGTVFVTPTPRLRAVPLNPPGFHRKHKLRVRTTSYSPDPTGITEIGGRRVLLSLDCAGLPTDEMAGRGGVLTFNGPRGELNEAATWSVPQPTPVAAALWRPTPIGSPTPLAEKALNHRAPGSPLPSINGHAFDGNNNKKVMERNLNIRCSEQNLSYFVLQLLIRQSLPLARSQAAPRTTLKCPRWGQARAPEEFPTATQHPARLSPCITRRRNRYSKKYQLRSESKSKKASSTGSSLSSSLRPPLLLPRTVPARPHHTAPLSAPLRLSSRTTEEPKCVSRESNAGPIDGNDGFYH